MDQRAIAKAIEMMIVFCEIEERFKDIEDIVSTSDVDDITDKKRNF